MKTKGCPNCGAKLTNNQQCDYCDALFYEGPKIPEGALGTLEKETRHYREWNSSFASGQIVMVHNYPSSGQR